MQCVTIAIHCIIISLIISTGCGLIKPGTMSDEDDCITNVVGYQKPDVILHTLNGDFFGDGDEVDVDNILPRIVQNDPAIAGFQVAEDDDDDLESIGRAIGSSRCLRRLEVFLGNGSDETDELLRNSEQHSFLERLASNRSIEHLKLHSIFDLDMEALAPFLEQNINLRCISCCGGVAPSLVPVLSRSKMNHLARIEFHYCELGDMLAAELFNALNSMPGLRNLLDLQLNNNMVASEGCVALCALLKNPDCRIESLNLSGNAIDDGCVGILISGLLACSSLKSLIFGRDLGREELFTSIGWKSFSTYLSNPRCLLQQLVLTSPNIGDASAGGSLALPRTLKYLEFSYIEATPTAWHGIPSCLVACASLIELNLSGCNVNDVGASDIFLALAGFATLKKLILMNARDITSVGWVACFQRLLDSQSALEILNFARNSIDDEGASVLASLLGSHMSTVLTLNLNDNDSITTNGWRAFVILLAPISTSKLKVLRLEHNHIMDDVLIEFIAALSNNNSLNELSLDGRNLSSIHALDALANVLCDKTSIANVCNSNHSLKIFHPDCYLVGDVNFFGYGIQAHYDELDVLLAMNKNPDKAEVIRTKLLTFFFSDFDNNGRVFGSMDTSMMPNVVEWIGRDRLGRSMMFELCRKMPELFQE